MAVPSGEKVRMQKRSHAWIDQRSLELAKAIAVKLRADPSLIDVARRNLGRWKARMEIWPRALREWEAILERGSLEEILEVLLDTGDTGCRLRQSSPFTGILTASERKAIFTRHDTIGA